MTPHPLPALACLLLHLAALLSALTGCGSHAAFTPPPIILNVSLSMPTVTVAPNGTPVYVQVTIVAPTETATFTIIGLPAGVSATYKESESNPSGLLTLIASSATKQGTYMPTITVGSSGQTASTSFNLVIPAANP
jgi:hypothetical protein